MCSNVIKESREFSEIIPCNLVKASVEKLQGQDRIITNLYSLLQIEACAPRKAKATPSFRDESQAVVLLALLNVVHWRQVESTILGWFGPYYFGKRLLFVSCHGSIALAALDILDSTTTADPVVGNVVVKGLTPQYATERMKPMW